MAQQVVNGGDHLSKAELGAKNHALSHMQLTLAEGARIKEHHLLCQETVIQADIACGQPVQSVQEVAKPEMNLLLNINLLQAEDGGIGCVKPQYSWPLDSKSLSSIHLTEHGLQLPGIQQ
jgi:hypothetical protein